MKQNLPKCCQDFDITLVDLIFPDRMTPEGREFVTAHGIGTTPLWAIQATDMGNGLVKVHHRCDKLNDDGSCSIYEDRPQICRDFQCSTRHDCECKGHGFIYPDTSP